MDSLKLINLVPYTFLNPLILLAYFMAFSEDSALSQLKIKPFYDLGGNSQRINLVAYAGFCLVATAAFIIFKILVLLPLATTPLTGWDIVLVQPGWRWLFGYIVTAVTLVALTSRQGLEGNVGGFIFAPFILLATLLLLINHVQWLLARVL
ncbi:MAG: hypothetical protein KKE94_03490 [Gammaproteobacteria bacterium]|nr:hypothetical protein [Gammaproteobacteria bacterium]